MAAGGLFCSGIGFFIFGDVVVAWSPLDVEGEVVGYASRFEAFFCFQVLDGVVEEVEEVVAWL